VLESPVSVVLASLDVEISELGSLVSEEDVGSSSLEPESSVELSLASVPSDSSLLDSSVVVVSVVVVSLALSVVVSVEVSVVVSSEVGVVDVDSVVVSLSLCCDSSLFVSELDVL
jgi:hypothetical protein